MKVLRAIGGFFAKIGRWIRDTAWVQPLLIVGGIFAVIFSIPYIVDAAKSNSKSGNEAAAFYDNYQLSLKGAKENNSEADQLFKYIETKDAEGAKKYGKKFFVSIIDESCAGCKDVFPGFRTLEAKFNKDEFVVTAEDPNKEFKYYTIFADEETKYELEGSETTFKKYFYENHVSFFENVIQDVVDSPYYNKNKGNDRSTGYGKLLEDITDPDTIKGPLTFMFDFDSSLAGDFGVTDILFNFSGRNNDSSSYGLARTLIDCWNHTGEFDEE